MSYYTRLRLALEVADNASYVAAQRQDAEVTATDDEYEVSRLIEAPTGAAFTLDLGMYTTISLIIVHNLAAVAGEYVTIGWTNAAGTACTARVYDSGYPLVLTDALAANDLTLLSSGAAVKACRVSIIGT